MFDGVPAGQIGEVWFVGEPDLPLLAKYLFTSDILSVQVHPDDKQAKERGYARGKSECWYILAAEPDARVGLGLRREVEADELRSAALDGSIAALIDWRPVTSGDFFYVPAGTIHAIGGGISLLEFQQNSGLTYRLYDYGRPRDLHLDDAIAVATRRSYPEKLATRVLAERECTLVDGPQFTLVHAHTDVLLDRRRWILPLEGSVRLAGDVARPGECLLAEGGERVETESARMLIGAQS